jgi:outer membrane protein TolC
MRMKRCGIVLVSAIGFFLSGCMVGPRYAKPNAPVTPNFKEADESKEGDGWKVAQPDDDLIRGKWWELYGDATLNEIEEQVRLVQPRPEDR